MLSWDGHLELSGIKSGEQELTLEYTWINQPLAIIIGKEIATTKLGYQIRSVS